MNITPIKEVINQNFDFLDKNFSGAILKLHIEETRKNIIKDIQFLYKKEEIIRKANFPPTKEQLEVARGLAIPNPENRTRLELSVLIRENKNGGLI